MNDVKQIYITDFDFRRLWELFKAGRNLTQEERTILPVLQAKLEAAKVVCWRDIAPNIVTMNSRVSLKNFRTQQKMVFDLVFPSYGNPERNKVSILTPIGAAMLGCQTEEIIESEIEGDLRQLVIEQILYQPEATGNFNL
jgi:regulator of nucleoside diphosphate kinase